MNSVYCLDMFCWVLNSWDTKNFVLQKQGSVKNRKNTEPDYCIVILFKTPGETVAIAIHPAEDVGSKKKHHTKQRRVVVTGMGVVTPLGHDLDVFYKNLLEGVSGISEIEAFDCSQFPTVNILGSCRKFLKLVLSVCLSEF